MTGSVQLPFGGTGHALPFDPRELATLTAPERGALYRAVKLDPVQIAVAEEATRAVVAGTYRSTYRRSRR